MNFTTVTKNQSGGHVYRPLFSGEGKKEEKCAKRINDFYESIIEAAVKKAEGNGVKYNIEIIAREEDGTYHVTLELRFRHRGRTVFFLRDSRAWANGVVLK